MRPLPLVIALATAATVTTSVAARDHIAPDPVPTLRYGAPTPLGRGHARVYVASDATTGAPIEVGVALDEGALDGLPAPSAMAHGASDGHEHVDSHVFDLAMPARNATPYRFVELDWNPGGHEPAGVYDVPHFDFHFYTVDTTVRNGIDPQRIGEQAFRDRSGVLPGEPERAPMFVALAPPGAPVMAVPRMGVHWIDVRTPELQALFGKAEAFRPFTTTFIHGSWNGRFIFDEPMVTRAFILGRKAATTAAQRDSVIALAQPKAFGAPGYYPAAYRIAYDAGAREYRVALTQLVKR